MSFSSNGQVLKCNSSASDPMADIRKLHAIISTYHLVSDATNATKQLGLYRGLTLDDWLDIPGVRHALRSVVQHTQTNS